MNTDCVVGIDIGTTSTRVAIYSVVGTLLGVGRSPHEISHPYLGWAEQGAEIWWQGVCEAAREAFEKFDYPRESIKGIAITSMRQTFVCLDRDLHPLRPAIVWYDTRHAAQVDWVRSNIGSRAVYELTGSPPGRRAIYKVMWLKEFEPDVYGATYKIVFIPDFVLFKMTGELVTTPGVSFSSGCLNALHPTKWASDFIDRCGVETDKWIEDIRMPGSIGGYVTTVAAAETGFPEGTPVILAASDQACGNLGVGVCQPGSLGINGGTSCALQTPSEQLPSDEAMSYFVDFSPAGYYVAENGITSGTAALTEWFRDNFGQPEKAAAEDEKEVWDMLFQLVNEAPPGNMGLMMVPYLRGANGPLWDPRARGLLVGLTTNHGREHLMRTLFEGLAYESRRIIESMEESTGVRIHSVRAYGGASQSDVWNQLFADVLGRTMTVTTESSPVSLGAAIVAGYGIGFYNKPVEASRRMVRESMVYEPDPEYAKIYNDLYHEVYINLYTPMKELIDTLSKITTPSETTHSVKVE